MNFPTILIAALVAAAFLAIVCGGVRKRKKGGTGCGCRCAGCPGAGLCHPQKQASGRG